MKIDCNFKIYNDDCNIILPKYTNTFDLIIADPPYFLSNNGQTVKGGKIVSVNKGEWDKLNGSNMNTFNYEWLNNAKNSLTDIGSLMVFATHHNLFSVGNVLQELNFKILNIITWKKKNPPPNFSCRYLTASTEFIIWAKKHHKAKHIFNYDILKKINNNKQMQDLWCFNSVQPFERTCGKHPTQKPLSIIIRLLIMATNSNSIVCDPFCGSGTTGIASNLLNIPFIGIEKEKDYIDIITKRKQELEDVKQREYIKSKIDDLNILNI